MAKRSVNILYDMVRLMCTASLRSRGDIAVGVVFELTGIGLSVAVPFVLKCIIDSLAFKGNAISPSLAVIILVTVFVAALCGGAIVSTARMAFTARVIDRLTMALSARALRSRLPAALQSRDGNSSHILGLLERLPFSLNIVCEGLIWRTGPMVLQLFACLAVIAKLIELRYVLVLSAMLVGYVAATWYGAVRQRFFASRLNTAAGAVSQSVGDVLRNARRVVVNGAIDAEVERVSGKFVEKRDANGRMWWSLVRLAGLQYGVLGIGLVLLLAMGAADVAAGRMTVGGFVLLEAYALRLTTPLSSFGFTLSQAGVSLANLGEVLELAPGSDVSSEGRPANAGPARLSFETVSFTYGPGMPGIQDVSFDLEPGTFNVIVGPNGSGKSTLGQVLAGILAPSQGEVLVDRRPVSDTPGFERHRRIMYIPQFIGLFDRSLGENVLYPPATQSLAEIRTLLAEWQFSEAGREIDFGAVVGEQGERLSGGQIQKLELARLAGVRVPAIVLDESTSSLDPASEEKVLEDLMQRFANRTTVVMITHRPGLAERADQVLFMTAGRLVDAGRHGDLLLRNSDYSNLWARQAGA